MEEEDEQVMEVRTTPTHHLHDRIKYHFIPYGKHELRLVEPQFHEFVTCFKSRWSGKSIKQIYQNEFSFTEEYIEIAINQGLILVNNKLVFSSTQILKLHDRLSHLSHRHEPPVIQPNPFESIIVYDDGDIVCVNKPATIPIHPSGSYRFNTLLHILSQYDYQKYGNLNTIHRLDRLTSGLVLFARTHASARRLSNAIQNTGGLRAQKTYLARVDGKFPNFLNFDENYVKYDETTGWMTVTYPIGVLDPKRGVHACDIEKGKLSISKFKLFYYDETNNQSLLKCEPITGRTHQLRVHLQAIGNPIVNDESYGGSSQKNDDDYDTIMPTKFHELCVKIISESSSVQEELDERHKSAKENCATCLKNYEPLRKYEIFLHSLRFRVFTTRNEKMIVDFRVPFPNWVKLDNEIDLNTVWLE